MNNMRFFLNLPVDFKGKCWVYPPTINDVAGDKFMLYEKILTISQEDLDDLAQETNSDFTFTPLEYLLANSYHDKAFEKTVKEAFMLFTHEEITLIYNNKAILIGNLEKKITELKDLNELIFITEEDYFEFQNFIRESLGNKAIEPPNPNEHPKIRRMKALARKRDRIKAKKQMGISLEAMISAICCMGVGITPLNVGEISYKAIQNIFHTYQEKEAYDYNMKALLAGAKKNKELTHWIRNIDI